MEQAHKMKMTERTSQSESAWAVNILLSRAMML